MKNDLIRRQDVLDYIDNMPSELTSDGRRMVRRIRLTEYIADTLPSAEPERPKGEWKPFDLTWGRSVYSCTACGETMDIPTEMSKPIYNFCPHCGADMRGKDGKA